MLNSPNGFCWIIAFKGGGFATAASKSRPDESMSLIFDPRDPFSARVEPGKWRVIAGPMSQEEALSKLEDEAFRTANVFDIPAEIMDIADDADKPYLPKPGEDYCVLRLLTSNEMHVAKFNSRLKALKDAAGRPIYVQVYGPCPAEDARDYMRDLS